MFYPYGPISVIKATKHGNTKGELKSNNDDHLSDIVGKSHSLSKSGLRALKAQYRWKAGQTGQPLVDANMRELRLTGEPSCCFLCF